MDPQDEERASPEAELSERELGRRQREAGDEILLSALRAHEALDTAEDQQKELVALAEVRERLLGILGHDLRNPLNALIMGLNLLVARGNLGEDDARVVERLLGAGSRMNRMILQILDFTRARLGSGLPVELEPGNLGDVCRSVAQELELAKSIHVGCTVEGDLTGRWDADRLAEVLMNIASNAVEHALPGTRIALNARAAGADVVVEISNEGHPIPPELLPFIFDPFRRAKAREHTRSSNIGLGLYIASELVKGHGGTLLAHSTGGTTTFTMRLPRSAAPSPA
jgi:signal transduction histidine kinase